MYVSRHLVLSTSHPHHGCLAIALSITPRHGLMDEGQAVVPVIGEDIVRGRGICRTGGIFFEIREIIPYEYSFKIEKIDQNQLVDF